MIAAALGDGGGWLGARTRSTRCCAPTGIPLAERGRRDRAAGRRAPRRRARRRRSRSRRSRPAWCTRRDAGARARSGCTAPPRSTRAAREMAAAVAPRATRRAASSSSAMAPAGVEMLVGVVGDPRLRARRRLRRRRRAPSSCSATCRSRLAPLGRGDAAEMMRVAADVPAARRLPRRAARATSRALEDVRRARRRARRRAPGDRRARLQPGDRRARRRGGGRRARARGARAPPSAVPDAGATVRLGRARVELGRRAWRDVARTVLVATAAAWAALRSAQPQSRTAAGGAA